MEIALAWIRKNRWPEGKENYAPIFVYFLTIFRSFRACENLVMNGYPLDGYSLLRDIKDRAIFLGGIANNFTTFPAIFGYEGFEEVNREKYEELKKKSIAEEIRVLSKMMKKDSGLPKETQESLFLWEKLFHLEVHGSKMTYYEIMADWLKGNLSSFAPSPKETSFAMYMNRTSEIAWLIVRVLPFLQIEVDCFGESWKEKRQILDESFKVMVEGLSKLGKDIGNAFITFVDKNYSFKEPFFYFEADGNS